ncbi:MAG TPA: methyltransferase domain-containing protein [Sphingomicrobium sp.]|nr:methyltransferase domain-containing protein [Sphingomicrobium sp.]
MSRSIPQAELDAAIAYESLMVPALLGPWCSTVADAANLAAGQRVLDIACGTGALAREAADRVGVTGAVSGLDLSGGMLAVAKRLAPDLEWREGAAESLPFPDDSFDRVISQFGLMFFRDRPAAVREALRVLHPEGRLAMAVWNSLGNIPAYADEVELLERCAGRAAADAVRAPFVLGDTRELAELFRDAGAASVAVGTSRETARFPSIRAMVEADLRSWLPLMGVVLAEERIADILEQAEEVLRPYVDTDGTITFQTSAHIVVARTESA